MFISQIRIGRRGDSYQFLSSFFASVQYVSHFLFFLIEVPILASRMVHRIWYHVNTHTHIINGRPPQLLFISWTSSPADADALTLSKQKTISVSSQIRHIVPVGSQISSRGSRSNGNKFARKLGFREAHASFWLIRLPTPVQKLLNTKILEERIEQGEAAKRRLELFRKTKLQFALTRALREK